MSKAQREHRIDRTHCAESRPLWCESILSFRGYGVLIIECLKGAHDLVKEAIDCVDALAELVDILGDHLAGGGAIIEGGQ